MIEVGGQRDRHLAILIRVYIVKSDVGAELIDDATAGVRGALHVPSLVERVLPQITALRVHRPDVHGPVPVALEVNAAVPPHRAPTDAAVVGGQRYRFLRARLELPEVLRRAALVALSSAALRGQAREVQRTARPLVRAVRRLRQRHQNHLTGGDIEAGELAVGESRIAARVVKQLSIRRPTHHPRRATFIGPSRRQPSRKRHRIDLQRPFVGSGKGERLTIRGDGGERLCRLVTRQPLRGATLYPDLPQVAFGGEHDCLAVDGGVAVVALGRLREQRRRHEKKKREDYSPSHRFAPTCHSHSSRCGAG